MRRLGPLALLLVFAFSLAARAQEAQVDAPEETAAGQTTDSAAETPAADTEPAESEPAEPVAEEAEPTDETAEEAAEEPGNEESINAPADESDVEEEAETEEEAGPSFLELVQGLPPLLAVLHHATVHMPIALWLLGALFVIVGLFAPSWRNQIPLACLIGGAITSVAAAATGWWYSDHENGNGWAWAEGIDLSFKLGQHRWLGVTLAVVSVVISVIALVSQKKQSKSLGFLWRVGLLVLAALVGWEGHIGGELVMGEGFLEEAIEAWLNPEG